MTLYQLECFIKVAELLSFGHAAQQMCISQPAITYQIQSLEKEMNVQLFERNTRSCHLTLAGESFYQDAVQMLSFSHQAIKRAQEIQRTNKSHLRVGIRKLFDYDRMTQSVEKFYQRYPQAEVDILPQNDANPLNDLRTERIDVGFFYSSEHQICSDISFMPLHELNYYVLMHADNELSTQKRLSLEDLKGKPVVVAGPDSNFLSAAQGPSIHEMRDAGIDLSRSASSFESALIMVRAEKAMLVLPMHPSTVVPGMVKVPLNCCQRAQMEIGWMKRDNRPEIQEFIEIVRSMYQEEKR